MATVTSTPASAAGLHDRGKIAVAQRADLIAFTLCGDVPVLQSVGAAGSREA